MDEAYGNEYDPAFCMAINEGIVSEGQEELAWTILDPMGV